jgi:GNAT superfamily N-acetyltransferase
MATVSDMSTVDGAPRVAGPADVDQVVRILVGAFADDPAWSWAFPDAARRSEQHAHLWRLLVQGAMRYRTVWLAEGGAATSVWIPPGGSELTPEDEAALESMVVDLLGPGAGRVLGAFEEFERAHPRDEPHWFLTLLGTDPQQRGKGHGLALLAANLRVVDEAGLPAYLEASNSANVPLYQRYGFVVRGSFRMPEGGPEVVTMWRDPRPATAPVGPDAG